MDSADYANRPQQGCIRFYAAGPATVIAMDYRLAGARAAINSISTRVPGTTRAATFMAARAGLLGCSGEPKNWENAAFMPAKSISPFLRGSPARNTWAATTSP